MIRETTFEEASKVHNQIGEFERRGPDYFRERCEGKESLILIAYSPEPSGYLIAYRYVDGSLYCWTTGVISESRQNGILQEMMQYMFDWAKSRGYRKIKIKTRNKRRAMLSYLVKHGFQFVKIIGKTELEENRILLEKKL